MTTHSINNRLIILLVALALLVTGCAAPAPAMPTATPFTAARVQEANTPAPAATLAPTDTPTSAPTQTPTTEPTPEPTQEPTATPTTEPTATATPVSTAPPLPTATPQPEAAASVDPEPVVVIPNGWPVFKDERLGYSLAHPSTWIVVDLRGDGFQSLARFFGAGAANLVEQLEAFLATPSGESIGIVMVEPDVTQFFSSAPFPALLNVSVLGLPEDVTAEQLQAALATSAGLFGSVTVTSSTVATINNLPGVHVISQADLSEVGFPIMAYVEQVGLIYDNQLYVLTLASKAAVAERKQAWFDAIIASFRPE